MKLNYIIIFGLFIGIICISVSVNAQENIDEKKGSDAISIIHNRKSIRDFTGQMVSDGILDTLARAGMAAPSAKNKQAWAYILINNRKTLHALADSLPSAKMLYKAGAAIIVCGDLSKVMADKKEFYWIPECAAASQNILLAIEALRLGGVWTGVFPDHQRVATVCKILGIPSDIIPLNVIAIGYPSGKDVPKNKYKKENIHWNKW